MVMKIDKTVDVFYLDTDFLFPETYALRDACEKKYGFKASGYKSLLTPDEQAEKHGPALWSRDPNQCCNLRKVHPLREYLAFKDAWITAIRRDQTANRANAAECRGLLGDPSGAVQELTALLTETMALSGPDDPALLVGLSQSLDPQAAPPSQEDSGDQSRKCGSKAASSM